MLEVGGLDRHLQLLHRAVGRRLLLHSCLAIEGPEGSSAE